VLTMSVHIIMGSRSDMNVAEKATEMLDRLGIEHEVSVASAHRDPEAVHTIVTSSKAEVFIAIAGLSAALPGVVASHTQRPVIGVPVSGKVNLDSILSVVQMPPGVPVAAVGLDNGKNAAIMAARILALKDDALVARLDELAEEMRGRTERSV